MKRIFRYKSKFITQAMCKTTFYTLGPKQGKTLLSILHKWCECRGMRDTAKRLKAILTAINLRLDKQFDKSDELLRKNSLRWNSRDLSVFRSIYNSLLYCKSDIKASRFYTVLKLYTGLKYEITDKDKSLLLTTVTEKATHNPEVMNKIIDHIISSRTKEHQISFDLNLVNHIVEGFDKTVRPQWRTVKTDLVNINHNKVRSDVVTFLPKRLKGSSIDYKALMNIMSSRIPYSIWSMFTK